MSHYIFDWWFFISVLEFIYAQSPESMKGLLTGLYFFVLGLTSIPSSALYYLYKDSLKNRVLVPFYAAFTIIMVGHRGPCVIN